MQKLTHNYINSGSGVLDTVQELTSAIYINSGSGVLETVQKLISAIYINSGSGVLGTVQELISAIYINSGSGVLGTVQELISAIYINSGSGVLTPPACHRRLVSQRFCAAYVQDVRANNCSCVICTSTIRGGRMPILHRYMDVA